MILVGHTIKIKIGNFDNQDLFENNKYKLHEKEVLLI